MKVRLPALRHGMLAVLLAYSSAQAADLLDLYRQARTSDPTYAGAVANYQATLEAYPQARAALLPQVGLSAEAGANSVDYTPRHSDLSGPSRSNSYNDYSVAVQATQSLYSGVKRATLEQGKLTADLAEVQLKGAEQNLMLRVSQAYFDVLSAEDTLSYIRAQKEATTQQLALAKKSFEVGTATITDTHEAQARYDQILAQELAAENALVLKNTALAQLIGKRVEGVAPLKLPFQPSAVEPSNVDTWLTDAEQKSLDVQAKQLAKDIAEQDVAKARAAHQPTLDLVATVARSGASGGTSGAASANDTTTKKLMLELNVPLYAGGALNSKSRESVARDELARQNLEASRRQANQDARTAYLGITSGLAQVKALEQALVSAETALKSTQLGQEVGVRTNLDVLNAQQTVYSTQRDLASARYQYVLSLLKLKAVVGSLSENDLAQLNNQLTH